MDRLGAVLAAISLILWTGTRRARSHRRIPPELAGSLRTQRLCVAVETALMAGEKIMKALRERKEVSSKGGVDFVTETDKANEEIIFRILRQNFPTDNFIGEASHFTKYYLVCFNNFCSMAKLGVNGKFC